MIIKKPGIILRLLFFYPVYQVITMLRKINKASIVTYSRRFA
jgi:hypothetical protein